MTERAQTINLRPESNEESVNVQNQNPVQVQRMLLEEKIEDKILREKLPTVFDQYRFVVKELGYYLPKWEAKSDRPKWATEKYLVGIIQGAVFGIKKEKVKKPVDYKNRYTKGEMLQVLDSLADRPLGFTTGNEPPVKWLIKVIYSLNPNHEMFQTIEEKTKRTIPEE